MTVSMGDITPEDARAYLQRWKLVRELEAAQVGQPSLEIRLRQLAALMASRSLFGSDPERERNVVAVRERWAQLRRALGD